MVNRNYAVLYISLMMKLRAIVSDQMYRYMIVMIPFIKSENYRINNFTNIFITLDIYVQKYQSTH